MEGARSLMYTVAAESAKVREFYLTELRAASFTEESPGLWRQGGEELRGSVRPIKTGRVAVILMSRTVVEDSMEPAVREVPRPERSQAGAGKR
jgi:hypothetical protein